MAFGAWSTFLGVLAVQTLILAVALWRSPANRLASRYLALLLVCVAGMLTPFIIGYAGAYDRWPWLSFAPFAVPLAIGPLLYGHVLALSRNAPLPRAHFIAPAMQFCYQGQIRLRPRDMMKIGVMVLQDGRFADRQILSRNWIEAMTTRQSVIDGDAWGYGLWLRDYRVDSDSGAQTVATIMFSGNGGQKIYVVPSLDLVVVSTGGSYNQGNAPINAIIAQVILPAALQARKSGEPL